MRHCKRCHTDVEKLYSSKGFHYCLKCKLELQEIDREKNKGMPKELDNE